MSIATDFRAALVGHSALTALVPAASIAQNALPAESAVPPAVVYGMNIETEIGLDGTNLGDRATITVQCWAVETDDAEAIAVAVKGALATVPNNAIVTTEEDGYDPEQKMHSQTLTVVWMQ
jgi:hypothetical protein